MRTPRTVASLLALAVALAAPAALAQGKPSAKPRAAARGGSSQCVTCHLRTTPSIVSDWKLSKHSRNGVSCDTCHGSDHQSKDDVAKVKLPTPDTCAECHATQVEQFKKSKHAFSWAAMKAMPTFHYQPMALMEGEKGCGGCHKIGLKSEADLRDVRKAAGGFGNASCDACHTRHTFSIAEARAPQACQTCHMGFDHPQWEMYSGSKHGVRNDLRQLGAIPKDSAAPTCQTCHMQEGNHDVRTAWGFLAVRLPMPEDKQWAADRATILQGLGVRNDLRQLGVIPKGSAGPTCQTCHMQDGNHDVRTAWGFLAVRLPMPEDKQWAADRATILQGLGVLDPDGKPTGRLDVVKAAQVARLTQEEFDAARKPMLDTCNKCHSANFVAAQFKNAEDLIRDADHVMAEGIRVVAGLYRDGVLAKPKDYAYAFPDLLTFHDAPTVPEQRLFVMFLEHRMRTFQGAFHSSPDYALWYGWSEMVRDLAEIKQAAAELRAKAGKPEKAAKP